MSKRWQNESSRDESRKWVVKTRTCPDAERWSHRKTVVGEDSDRFSLSVYISSLLLEVRSETWNETSCSLWFRGWSPSFETRRKTKTDLGFIESHINQFKKAQVGSIEASKVPTVPEYPGRRTRKVTRHERLVTHSERNFAGERGLGWNLDFPMSS